jgi:hypothetical protein
VKVPDSNPPFTRVRAQVLVELVEVEEALVNRVTVVRVDDAITEPERWSAEETDFSTHVDVLEEILGVVEEDWMVVTAESTDVELLEERLKDDVVELTLWKMELGAARFDCDDEKVLWLVELPVATCVDEELSLDSVALLCGAARFEIVEVAAAGCVNNDLSPDCVEMLVGAARLELVKLSIADDCKVAEDIVVDTAALELVALPDADVWEYVEDCIVEAAAFRIVEVWDVDKGVVVSAANGWELVVLAAPVFKLLLSWGEVEVSASGTEMLIEDWRDVLTAPVFELPVEYWELVSLAAPTSELLAEVIAFVLAAPELELFKDWEMLVTATPGFELVGDKYVVLAAPTFELVEDWAVLLAAPTTELPEIVEAAAIIELLRLDGEDKKLLSVDAEDKLEDVLPTEELGAAEPVAKEDTVELGALVTAEELVWLVVDAEFGYS